MSRSDRDPIILFDRFEFDIYNSYLKSQSKKNNNNKFKNNNNKSKNNKSKNNKRKDVKVIYPSIFIQEVKLYGSDGEISDILYLLCLRGDIRPKMNPDDTFLIELRLNPIIGDLFDILLKDRNNNNLKTGDREDFAYNLTSKEFVEMINKKMAEKLKVFRRLVFGNVELTNNQIAEMEKLTNNQMEQLERASLNLFYVKSSGLGKAFEKLQTMYVESNDNRFNSISVFTIDKLEKLLEAKEKIDIIKSKSMRSPKSKSSRSQTSNKRTLKRGREPTTPGNPYPTTPLGKNPKINYNTVSTVLLNRTTNKSNRTQIINTEPPPSPQF